MSAWVNLPLEVRLMFEQLVVFESPEMFDHGITIVGCAYGDALREANRKRVAKWRSNPENARKHREAAKLGMRKKRALEKARGFASMFLEGA